METPEEAEPCAATHSLITHRKPYIIMYAVLPEGTEPR